MDLIEILSVNLKKIRAQRNLSLDSLAELTGVSKSMLGQIERGVVNPTISTVWKIADGLKLSFTTLISDEERAVDIVRREELRPFLGEDQGFRTYPIFPFDAGRRFENYMSEVKPGSSLRAQAHPALTQEFITLFTGTLEVDTGHGIYQLSPADSIRFQADVPHGYRNTGRDTVLLSMVIYYPPV